MEPCCPLPQVAEATVLHNEAQLQESLEARCTAEEQVWRRMCLATMAQVTPVGR